MGTAGNESSPYSTFPRVRHLLYACLLAGLGGIRLPLGPPAIIDSLDPCAPSDVAPLPPDLLHVASTSHLPDETGWHRGACTCHNSSTRHDGPNAINHLHKVSTDGTRLEATLFAGKEAPQWPRGLRRLPRRSSPTSRSMGARVAHPPKTNQLPRVGSGATE